MLTTDQERNYCITAHVAERLEELREAPYFAELREEIAAAIRALDTRLQLLEAQGLVPALQQQQALITFLEDTFSRISFGEDGAAYTALLDYLNVAGNLLSDPVLQPLCHALSLSLQVTK